MNSDLYLVKVITNTGRVLYIDESSAAWSEGSFGFPDYRGPLYYDDFEEAQMSANVYGGEVVKCVFTIEPVGDEK